MFSMDGDTMKSWQVLVAAAAAMATVQHVRLAY